MLQHVARGQYCHVLFERPRERVSERGRCNLSPSLYIESEREKGEGGRKNPSVEVASDLIVFTSAGEALRNGSEIWPGPARGQQCQLLGPAGLSGGRDRRGGPGRGRVDGGWVDQLCDG